MDSFKIEEKMFVLSRTRSKKIGRELVYYVEGVSLNGHFKIRATTNRGEIIDDSPAIPNTSLVPFWLQIDTVYRFDEGAVRIYDITPDAEHDDHIIAFKTATDSDMKYYYYSTFIQEFKQLKIMAEI